MRLIVLAFGITCIEKSASGVTSYDYTNTGLHDNLGDGPYQVQFNAYPVSGAFTGTISGWSGTQVVYYSSTTSQIDRQTAGAGGPWYPDVYFVWSNSAGATVSTLISGSSPVLVPAGITGAIALSWNNAGARWMTGDYGSNNGGLPWNLTTWLSSSPPPPPIVINTKGDLGKKKIIHWIDLIADPVSPITGDFCVKSVDLHVNGPLPIEISRTYSSGSLVDNELGAGWLTGYPAYLVTSDLGNTPDTIQASDGDGAVIEFKYSSASDTWVPRPTDNPQLTNESGGSKNLLNSYVSRTAGPSGPLGFQWKFPDGSTHSYVVQQFPIPNDARKRPYLSSLTDSEGNVLSFTFGTVSTSNDYGHIARISSSNGSWVVFGYDADGHITSATADDGRSVYYGYDKGDLYSVVLPGNNDNINYLYVYYYYGIVAGDPSTSNHLLLEEHKDDRVLVNTYDSSRRVKTQKATVDIAQPAVPVVNAIFTYVSGVTTVTDANNHLTTYEYSNGLITKVIEPEGIITTKDWYAASDSSTGAYIRSLKKSVDPRGLVTEYKYDVRGNVVETKLTGDLDGDPATTETATGVAVYNVRNLPDSVTNAAGITTAFLYEDTNYPYRPTTITMTKAGSPLRVDKFSYTLRSAAATSPPATAKGLLAHHTLAYGTPDEAVTDYDYDETGFCTSVTRHTGTTDPDVGVTFTPTLRREVYTETDGDGRSTTYEYDRLSHVTKKTVKAEIGTTLGMWNFLYTNNDEIKQINGPRSSPDDLIEHDYDTAGRPKQDRVWRTQAKADGTGVEAPPTATIKSVINYEHDLFGNLVKIVDPLGNAARFDYDGMGRLLTRRRYVGANTADTAPSLRTESYTYEPGDLVEKYTNPLGGDTTIYYTQTGQPRYRQNPDSSVLGWRYYTDGRIYKEILLNQTYWETTYDDIAHTVTRTLKKPDATVLATEMRHYDLRGNLVSLTDREGCVYTTSYDGLGRVKTVTGPAATAGTARQSTATYYGASAKTIRTVNAVGDEVTVTSDALGRPVVIQTKNATGTVIHQTGYAYSSDHQSVAITEGTGTGAIIRTIYADPEGRTLLAKDGGGKFTLNRYDLNGNLVTTTDPLNHTTTWAYNELNQLATQRLPDTALTTFTHDAAGHLTLRSMPGGLTSEELFDNAGRITSSRLYTGADVSRPFTYSYYPSGNSWAGLLQTATAPRDTVTIAYDDFLRLKTLTTDGSDAVTDGTTTYGYDKRNLLTSISQSSVGNAAGPATAVARTYDGYRQLLTEKVTVAGSVQSTVSQTWDGAGRRASLDEAGSTLPAPLFAYQHQADGRTTRVTTNSQNHGFAFGDNGLLLSRANPYRTLTVNTRDAVGRITQQTDTVGAAAAMVEAMTWLDDGTLDTYGVTHAGTGAWNEARAYGYNTRGQVTGEGFSPASATTATLAYAFDGGTAGGIGVRTEAKVGGGAPGAWQSSATAVNTLARVTTDQANTLGRSVPASGVSLGADHVDLFLDGVSQGRAVHPGWADNTGAWSKTLTMDAGVHTLTANAVHPSGSYTATATSTFTVNAAVAALTSTYDADGNVSGRTMTGVFGQTLTWDAFNRLIKVAQRDGGNNGYDWTAVYDGLGRRLKTTQQPVTANVASGTATVTTSIYDPQVEFLEIGVAINGVKAWKLYGPDMNGRFGGLNGTGGLEATIVDANRTTKGVINDSFGNGVASVSGGAVTWFPTRVGAYGPLPNTRAEVLTDVTRVAEATAWRSRRIDPTGFYNLGARYYEATSGRFLSPDPMGHAASMSLYDYCSGDPVNGFDADGRVMKKVAKGFDRQERKASSAFVGGVSNWAEHSFINLINLRNPLAPTGDVIGGAIIGTSDILQKANELTNATFDTVNDYIWGDLYTAPLDSQRAIDEVKSHFDSPQDIGGAAFDLTLAWVLHKAVNPSANFGETQLDAFAAAENAVATEIKVIGRIPDTAVAKQWPGHDVLDIPNWTPAKNSQWVSDGIANGQPFYTATPQAGNLIQSSGRFAGQPTIYAQELQQIQAAGYVKVGDYFVPAAKAATFKP